MVRKLIEWAVHNPLIVCLFVLALLTVGGYAFFHVNVEAYPDPAPPILDVVAQYPGASAEEMERQVTIPLEVALSGMPGLQVTRSRTLFGLSHLRNQFDYSRTYEQARQEVINRVSMAKLPPHVSVQISPTSPTGEILRYTLSCPRDPLGKPYYTLSDLKTLADYVVELEMRRIPRIAGVVSFGGTTKRYEIQPDPDRLYQYGITLAQLQKAVGDSNSNGSGSNLTQGQINLVVRSLGLYGQGQDPMQRAVSMKTPREAANYLRSEEARRIREIRQTVVASVNNVPIRVDHLVDGGPLLNIDGTAKVPDEQLVQRGVVVSFLTRQGKISVSQPRVDSDGEPVEDADGEPVWIDEDERVQGVVMLRKNEASLPALHDLEAKIEELNKPGHLLPGVQIEPYYDRMELINVTTETVHENLLVGMTLVTVILLMFLSNVRVALIVAINIPLALLFAFAVLFLRGKSANLLSIGAVDFGIIVDSSVIMVESIYRHLTSGDYQDLPLTQRIVKACSEVDRALFFSTIIMVCALLPLFTMTGPEGQIFGPMADTYAFALGGALLLALTVSPVMCVLFLKNLKPARENFLVRGIKSFYLWQLGLLLRIRWLAVLAFVALIAGTGVLAWNMGREFMPELEEGNLYIRGTLPMNISFEEVSARAREIRKLIRKNPEVRLVISQLGRPDDGTEPTGYYNVEIFAPLHAFGEWPIAPGWDRPRTKAELVAEINEELDRYFPGVDWDFSQIIRDMVLESLSGIKGENSIKIFGPDLAELEKTANQVKDVMQQVPGVINAGVCHVQGQSNLEFPIDRQKCARWNVSTVDLQNVIQTAVAGQAFTQMIEGGKTFDITLRLPEHLRSNEQAILNIPVDVAGHQLKGNAATVHSEFQAASNPGGLSATGSMLAAPSVTGNAATAPLLLNFTPRRRLGDLISSLDENGEKTRDVQLIRPGAAIIYREQGNRLIAVKFGIRGRDLASTVAEGQKKTEPLIQAPYHTEWSGEFEQMQKAESRMAVVFGISFVMILILLYLAFRSFLDAAVVCVNVLAVSVGGVWALWLTGLNFNISAAVGFISILGVAVMNGLIMVSSFNALRAHDVPLAEALREGLGKRLRPLTMTLLTAILGLLPAALSTRIGAQSQRPLAIVVVGGMLATIVLMNVIPILYSFYGHRTPPEGAGSMDH